MAINLISHCFQAQMWKKITVRHPSAGLATVAIQSSNIQNGDKIAKFEEYKDIDEKRGSRRSNSPGGKPRLSLSIVDFLDARVLWKIQKSLLIFEHRLHCKLYE